MKKFTYKTPYDTFKKCIFEINEYGYGGLCFDIVNEEGLVTGCTVRLGDIENNQAYINDYENEGMLKFLTKMGIVKNVIKYSPSGFVMIPLCEIDIKLLDEYGYRVD